MIRIRIPYCTTPKLLTSTRFGSSMQKRALPPGAYNLYQVERKLIEEGIISANPLLDMYRDKTKLSICKHTKYEDVIIDN